jgi:hypothetical protein
MKLFIIGNGFDIAHRINTGFSSYREWLGKLKESSPYKYLHSGIYPFDATFWNEFETNICMLRPKTIEETKECFGDDIFCRKLHRDIKDSLESFIIDEIGLWENQYLIKRSLKNEGKMYLSPSYYHVSPYDDSEEKILDITNNDYCLSFNYTDLPLTLYRINHSQFLAIHGLAFPHKYLDSEKDAIVFGHNDCHFRFDKELAKTDPVYCEFMKNSIKNTKQIIKNHLDFFYRLIIDASRITEVVVFGCSFSMVDLPYFEEVIEALYSNSSIVYHIGYFSNKDIEAFQRNYAKTFSKTNYKLVESKFLESKRFKKVVLLNDK